LLYEGLVVREGSEYTASFWAKAATPTRIAVNLQLTRSPWHIIAPAREIDIGDRWQRVSVRLTARRSSSEAKMNLIVGFTATTIWLANASLRETQQMRPLPDCLKMFDGRRVTTAEQWKRERRPELKILFQHYMYGYMPPPPANVRWAVRRVNPRFFEGKAVEKEVRIFFGPPGTPPIDVFLAIPARRTRPAPIFVGLAFGGPGGYEYPVKEILDRGYAVAVAQYEQISPDRDNLFHRGIFPFFRRPGQTGRDLHDWGAIAMWAWGLQRIIDYLETLRDVDQDRIAVTGFSRLGKVALLAAAFDERIDLTIPHQAGLGGSAPSRRMSPHAASLEYMNSRYPYWVNLTFPLFNDQVDRLPFDQHCLVALFAPRPVLFTNGDADLWADPSGQFEVLSGQSHKYDD
jgi:dienelactone hydrolase